MRTKRPCEVKAGATASVAILPLDVFWRFETQRGLPNHMRIFCIDGATVGSGVSADTRKRSFGRSQGSDTYRLQSQCFGISVVSVPSGA